MSRTSGSRGAIPVRLALALASAAIAAGTPATTRGAIARKESRSPFAEGVAAFHAGAYDEAETALGVALAEGADRTGSSKAGGEGLRDGPRQRQGRRPAPAQHRLGALPPCRERVLRRPPGPAREDFETLSRQKSSRFGVMAAFRWGDCLWALGDHAAAAEQYRKLPPRPAKDIDAGIAHFRLALFAEERGRPDASKMFLAFYRDFPAHPLSAEAQRHLGRLGGGGVGVGVGVGVGEPAAGGRGGAPAGDESAVAPEDRLRRADALSRGRNWDLALAELASLPARLPAALAVERDFQMGMTKFNMRRDYEGAARLLLGAAPALTGDKAASALFHGTRALSRIDRDDDAIAGYKQVVARFPGSRFAAEAQFLSGWLDYNRGRYRESLPGLRTTLEHFGKSPFADDAAWCLAFAHYLLGERDAAAQAMDRYAALPPTGMTPEEHASRVAYWRARLAAKLGDGETARRAYLDINRQWPFTFYGVAARARLAEAKSRSAIELPAPAPGGAANAPPRSGEASVPGFEPAMLARLDELASVGLEEEAGWELEREERARSARAQGGLPASVVAALLPRYAALKNFHRAYELAESRTGAGALASAPTGTARLWWQAAYPRAYADLVERYGRETGNPELFLYAIMRKESAFSPWDVSYADARGLLQMIPPTSAKVAREANLDFTADDLYDPEINVHLGALYIGGLATKFGGQVPLVAGAYNAGPKAMAKWCDQHGGHPTDEFVELIAFTQTREYAKRVVGIYARYRHLYGPGDYALPLTVDPHYRAGGPDY